jgi:hypothetical protein
MIYLNQPPSGLKAADGVTILLYNGINKPVAITPTVVANPVGG